MREQQKEMAMLLLSFLFLLFHVVQSQKELIKVIVPSPLNDESKQTTIFQIYFNEDLWFESNEIFIHFNDRYYTTTDSSLTLIKQRTRQNKDSLGSHEEYTLSYAINDESTKENEIIFNGIIKVYDDFVLFNQQFPKGLKNTSTNNADLIVSGFPTFVLQDRSDCGQRSPVGFAHWVSWFYKSASVAAGRRSTLVAPGFATPVYGKWDDATLLQGGIGGSGVTAVFDKEGRNTVVMSPFTQPMTVSHISPNAGELQWGLMGNLTEIPKNFEFSTILFFGNNGITQTMQDWGKVLRSYYKKPSAVEARKKDMTLQYLGFTTDNGAYYYYHTDNNETYEETLINVSKYAKQVGLPYQYILLDSWWYYKGTNGGVSNWIEQPELFPKGLPYLFQQTGWKVQAHNRYWALDNVYSKNQGGKYNFIEDPIKGGAVPVDKDFWTDLLSKPSKEWGLTVYEQDWLWNEFDEYVTQMLESVDLGHQWLTQMAEGARNNGLTIQYCMPFIRHLIQSLEFDLVTQARASDDYVVAPYNESEANPNWRIGGQALLIDALGMSPSKDGYWSTSYQPGNPYGEERFEPCPRLQAAVTSLSAGPIAIADGIGYSDVSLIMKHCRSDGKLLLPSSPATPIDLSFVQSALSADGDTVSIGPKGDVWFAPSIVPFSSKDTSSVTFGSLFVAELKEDWNIRPSHVSYLNPKMKYVVREANNTQNLIVWSESNPLSLKVRSDFFLFSCFFLLVFVVFSAFVYRCFLLFLVLLS
jgi:hypothetical protein